MSRPILKKRKEYTMRYYKFVLKSIDPLDENLIKTHVIFEAGDDYSKMIRDAFESAINICESLAQDFLSISDEDITGHDKEIIKRMEKKLGGFSQIVWKGDTYGNL